MSEKQTTARAEGLRRLAALRRRMRRIRQVVAALAAAMFIAVFATISVQMASGRDPVLGASVTQTASTSQSSGSSSSPSGSSSSSDSSSSDSSDSSSGLSPMTTSQS